MTNKIIQKFYLILLITALTITTIGAKAENILTIPSQHPTKTDIINTSFTKINTNYKIKFVKIDLSEFYGSGTIVPQGYLANSGILSQEGLITTSHIFQDQRIKDYFTRSQTYNLSGNETLKCKYSFGETDEYAIFIPIKTVYELQNQDLISISLILDTTTNSKIEPNQINKLIATNLIGAKSSFIDLSQSGVQSGDSGAMIFQGMGDNLNMLGVQFGYSKNTTNPYTVFWRLLNNNGNIDAKVNWISNKTNSIEWENGEYIPKNCSKKEPKVIDNNEKPNTPFEHLKFTRL